MKFYAGPTFLFLNLTNFLTFDVNFIMNTFSTMMDIVPPFNADTKRGILIAFTIQTLVSSSQTRT